MVGSKKNITGLDTVAIQKVGHTFVYVDARACTVVACVCVCIYFIRCTYNYNHPPISRCFTGIIKSECCSLLCTALLLRAPFRKSSTR
jgi:hypothetical protein